MKSVKVLATAALLSLAIGSSSYAASKPIEITPSANVALPMGTFGDAANLGIGGSGTLDFFIANAVSVGVLGGYTSFSSAVDGGSALGDLEITGHVRYYFGTDMAKAFFIQGNAGIHSLSGGGDSQSKFGFAFGAGKRFGMSSGKSAIVAEALYYIVPGDFFDADFLMFRLGWMFGLNKSGK